MDCSNKYSIEWKVIIAYISLCAIIGIVYTLYLCNCKWNKYITCITSAENEIISLKQNINILNTRLTTAENLLVSSNAELQAILTKALIRMH